MPPHRYSARREVLAKSDARIEREAAKTWTGRALACYALAEAGDLSHLLRAEDYRHEALEHAALAADGGRLVGATERQIAPARRRALARAKKRRGKG